MHCNGKCHLMKELAKAAENEKPISSDKKNSTTELKDLFIQQFVPFNFKLVKSNSSLLPNFNYSNLYSNLNSNTIFHPPISIS